MKELPPAEVFGAVVAVLQRVKVAV
jgi:hypothetical protein